MVKFHWIFKEVLDKLSLMWRIQNLGIGLKSTLFVFDPLTILCDNLATLMVNQGENWFSMLTK
jgi:hypothetical protein